MGKCVSTVVAGHETTYDVLSGDEFVTCVPVTTAWCILNLRVQEGFEVRKEAANVLNKH